MRQRDPVRHLRVGEEGNPNALRPEQERTLALAGRGERAGRSNAGTGQRPPGGVDSGLPAIERVVRGRAARIKPRSRDRARKRGRRIEARVSDRRCRGQRRFDMAERERVATHPGPDRPQHRPEVVARPPASRARGRRSADAAKGRRSRRWSAGPPAAVRDDRGSASASTSVEAAAERRCPRGTSSRPWPTANATVTAAIPISPGRILR